MYPQVLGKSALNYNIAQCVKLCCVNPPGWPGLKEQEMKRFLSVNGVKLGLASTFLLGFLVAALVRPFPASAGGLDLGDLLGDVAKIGGLALAVDKFGPEINKTINKVMNNNDVSTNASTKVVVIVSPIGNKHIGAAQVVGPKEAVDKVGAVAQLETSFMDKMFRIKALVPIEGKDASTLKRVEGVGVSAVIDIKL